MPGHDEYNGDDSVVRLARLLTVTAALTCSANRCQISGRQAPLAAPDVDGNIQIRGIGNRFDLLAVISLTAEKLLPGGLAGEGKELRPARQDRCTQARPRNLSEFGQRYLMIHPKMGFHEIRETDPVIEKIAILMRLQ